MKTSLLLLLLATALPAFSAPDQPPAHDAIDNTPVMALEIGSSITPLKTMMDLSDPQNPAWRDAQQYSLALGMAPPVHPSVNLRYNPNAPALPLFLRAAKDGDRLYLRLRWADTSQNVNTNRSEFADGAAVQFALGDAASTSFMMGGPGNPVNIWYWKAGQMQAQDLAAAGFGSTTMLSSSALTSSSLYRSNGEWVLVFTRPLSSNGEHQVQLNNGPASMTFALWQGDQKQRDGLKHVFMGWISLESGHE